MGPLGRAFPRWKEGCKQQEVTQRHSGSRPSSGSLCSVAWHHPCSSPSQAPSPQNGRDEFGATGPLSRPIALKSSRQTLVAALMLADILRHHFRLPQSDGSSVRQTEPFRKVVLLCRLRARSRGRSMEELGGRAVLACRCQRLSLGLTLLRRPLFASAGPMLGVRFLPCPTLSGGAAPRPPLGSAFSPHYEQT